MGALSGTAARASAARVVPHAAWVVLALWLLPACSGDSSVRGMLLDHPERFGEITSNPGRYRAQVLLSEIVDDGPGRTHLRRSGYRVDAEYFYPASAIKLGAAIACVQTLETLAGSPGLDDPLTLYPLFPGEAERAHDPTNLDGGTITLAHEIRKLFLVSDNEAFNRLYDFVGHRELNARLRALGLDSTVVNHRLSVRRTPEENRRTPRVDIRAKTGVIVVPARTSDATPTSRGRPGLAVGEGYVDARGEIVRAPMDFSDRNAMGLRDLQDLLVMLARPDISVSKGPLVLGDEHRAFLLDAMGGLPRESRNPRYDGSAYPDDYAKFLLPGLARVRPAAEWRVVNKVGQAYGFTIENAYVTHVPSGRSFFLAAVVYTNADGILNDDRYEYASVALPFMADLGELVARELGLGAAE